MADPIPGSVRDRFWDLWSIRLFIILSLSLQLFLCLFSSLRKKTGNMVVYFLIWSAYLLAHWVPTFTNGLILNSVSTSSSTSSATSTPISSMGPGIDDDLLALWAASLVWQLGGTFSITTFALEDNELWFRHCIVMVVDFVKAFYVFLLTLPHNKLLLPTIFALLGGLLSNVLRVYSMHLASLGRYRSNTVTEPDPTAITDTMITAHLLKEHHEEDPSEPLDRWDVLLDFNFFKGLLVDIKCKFDELEKIVEVFCDRISSENAYRPAHIM